MKRVIKTSKSILTTGILAACLLAINGRAALTMEVLASFDGTNGANPVALVQGVDGNFYGVTEFGGIGFQGLLYSGNGTVFRMTPDGSVSNLVWFNGTNGRTPVVVMRTASNNFYGTSIGGHGSIFKLAPDGTLIQSNLVTFNNEWPLCLVEDPAGNLYGVTERGTTASDGRLFKIDTNGAFTTMAIFNGTNGAQPVHLVLHTDGNFYGVAQEGGIANDGTLFKMTPDGTLNVLLSFQGTNGSSPNWLMQGSDGNLYGTTFSGDLGYGSVFKASTDGMILWSFSFDGTHGSNPNSLIQGADGNFYGTAQSGGAGFSGPAFSGNGTIFKISPDGIFTSLLLLDATNSIQPVCLIVGNDGRFYGTTLGGGPPSYGTVFNLSVPMAPTFRKTELTSNQFTLTWSAVAGQSYQLQYNSDLNSTNWNNLGSPVVATNGTMSASDSFGSDAQRFYRVALLP